MYSENYFMFYYAELVNGQYHLLYYSFFFGTGVFVLMVFEGHSEDCLH